MARMPLLKVQINECYCYDCFTSIKMNGSTINKHFVISYSPTCFKTQKEMQERIFRTLHVIFTGKLQNKIIIKDGMNAFNSLQSLLTTDLVFN